MILDLTKKIYRFIKPSFQTIFLEYKVDFKPRYGHGKPGHPMLTDIIEKGRGRYKEILLEALKYKSNISTIQDSKLEKDGFKPTWNNGFLPGLDIVGIYAMISKFQPKKYLEIGSGNSTKVAHKARVENEMNMEIISIDPQPRAEIDQLADQVIREPFENLNMDISTSLEAGDILFIDNSHRILPNSDSTVFFLEVLPKLKPGVIVHVHDIYLPYDYPQFMCDRFYSEQYGLAMYLLANPDRFEVLLPNYFISEDKELSQIIAPMWDHDNLKGVERHGGSFWFTINE